jgi:2-oxoglutarate ferredoxin oxidoreductase subunit beta
LIFGLTAGQPSCATPKEVISPYASDKSRVDPLSIVDLAVINGAKFVARAPETDLGLIQEVIKEAITFKGFAIVEIIQPCKIWARGAKQIKFRKISKPFSDSKKLIGKSDLVGLLYREN